MRWDDCSYLQAGTKRQRRAYRALAALNLFEVLAPFNPILVGTIPLKIDLSDSDLDIVCEARDLPAFERILRGALARHPEFSVRHQTVNDLPVVVCRFKFDGFPVEIFGQPRPVQAQNAFRHMAVEARLLALAGEAAREEIRQLKREGLKTEPAFGEYFALAGDPFETLYRLSDAPDETLRAVVASGARARAACAFCQIVQHNRAASVVFKDPFTLAFMDLRQANPGHVLVIPRRHVETVFELDDSLAARVWQTVVRVSRGMRAAFNAGGLSIWQSNGAAAFQEVPHVHVHLFPRHAGDGYVRIYPALPPHQPRAALDALAARIRAAL